jgi:hypothetical protein
MALVQIHDDQAVTILSEAIKMLLRSPDLNLDSLEEDTIRSIKVARKAIKMTQNNCNIQKLINSKMEKPTCVKGSEQ